MMLILIVVVLSYNLPVIDTTFLIVPVVVWISVAFYVTFKYYSHKVWNSFPQPINVELNHMTCLGQCNVEGNFHVPILAKSSKDSIYCYRFSWDHVIWEEHTPKSTYCKDNMEKYGAC